MPRGHFFSWSWHWSARLWWWGAVIQIKLHPVIRPKIRQFMVIVSRVRCDDLLGNNGPVFHHGDGTRRWGLHWISPRELPQCSCFLRLPPKFTAFDKCVVRSHNSLAANCVGGCAWDSSPITRGYRGQFQTQAFRSSQKLPLQGYHCAWASVLEQLVAPHDHHG